MKDAFPERESDMYPVIRGFFEDTLKCDKVFADGDEVFVRLRKNLHVGEVDLTALEDPDSNAPKVHFVEAKKFAKRQSFDECFSQLHALRESGDRLWVAFPQSQWKSLDEDDRRSNEKKLIEFGFGLLLVNPRECIAEIKAPLNRDVRDAGRTQVLQQLGFSTDLFFPPVLTLGSSEARAASRIMVLTCMVADLINTFEPRRKFVFQTYRDVAYDEDFVSRGWYMPTFDLPGEVLCELDPFGCLLEDGVPTLWVEIEIPLEEALARVSEGSTFGTHVYLQRGEWEWKTVSILDGLAVKYWADRGFSDVVYLLQRVNILGRLKASLRSQLETVIQAAKEAAAS